MTYSTLARLGLTVRPLDTWPGPRTTDPERSRFTAPMSDTVGVLSRELSHLDASNIIMMLGIAPSALRVDGLPYANARCDDPGVIVAFDSTAGPLRFACDRYRAGGYRSSGADWTHNLRAIALTLQALRTVERYGATRDQEQYRGYAQLPAGTPMPATHMTTDDAAKFIWMHGGGGDPHGPGPDDVIHEPRYRDVMYRAAARRLHPDAATGDTGLFQQLQAAKALLDRSPSDG